MPSNIINANTRARLSRSGPPPFRPFDSPAAAKSIRPHQSRETSRGFRPRKLPRPAPAP